MSPAPAPAPANHVQWYYPAGTPAAASVPFHHQHHQAVPFYGYVYYTLFFNVHHDFFWVYLIYKIIGLHLML